MTVSVVWLWLAVAGVLASWLVVWGVAYSMGGKAVEERLARYAPTDPPPAASLQPNVPPKTAGAPEKQAAKPAAQNPPQGAPKQASPAPATPGLPAADTRQAGFNYLLCASGLDKAAAEAAAGFLTQNGVPATAAPTGKTGSKYAVYTLLGIPSGSLDEQLKVRNDHKAEVVRLGKLWKKDNPRASDYSDAYWEKFKQ